MSSTVIPRCDAGKACGKRTLQRLRREAGYSSAKEFAAVLNIPNSTYSRYERAPEGPNSGIPLPAAWAMADELGVSIDLVVGRDDIDAQHTLTLDDRVRRLSRSGREMLDDFMRYLEFRETANAAQDWRQKDGDDFYLSAKRGIRSKRAHLLINLVKAVRRRTTDHSLCSSRTVR